MGVWLILLLLVLAIAVTPAWPYSRTWGYFPVGGVLVVLLLLLLAVWFGFVAMGWPWAFDAA